MHAATETPNVLGYGLFSTVSYILLFNIYFLLFLTLFLVLLYIIYLLPLNNENMLQFH